MREYVLSVLALEKWGKQAQIMMVVEELGELLQAISKVERDVNGCEVEELADEIADVEIMLTQLKTIYSIDDTLVQQIKMGKLDRLAMILKGTSNGGYVNK